MRLLTPHDPPLDRRRHRWVHALALAVGGIVLVASLTACSPEQDHVRDLVNSARASNGRAQLAEDAALDEKATGLARWIAGTHVLAHSHLADGVSPGWIRLGENIGYGSSIDAVQTAYMGSSGHRANILDSRFNRVGTGYATGRCPNSSATCVYTVQEFAQY